MKLRQFFVGLIVMMLSTTIQAQCTLNTDYTNTGSNMTLFITPEAVEDIDELGIGTIAAYFTNYSGEVCGGSTVVNGEQTSFPVMADDATTLYKDGFANGDELVLKYITDSGNIYNLEVDPADSFTTNAILFVNHFSFNLHCGEENVGNIEGCTDSNFVEYNPEATIDDGSCHNWIVEGCTLEGYLEYNPQANVNDGSCITPIIYGCINPLATNYNSNANVEDGTCDFELPEEVCEFSFENVNTGSNHTIIIPAGTSDFLNEGDDIGVYYTSPYGEIYSCGYTSWSNTTMQIVAYGDDATTPQIDGLSNGESLNFIAYSNGNTYAVSAEFQQEGMDVYTLNGISFVSSLEFELLCETETEVIGCTDSEACNYNPEANTEDGSCIYQQDEIDTDVLFAAANWGASLSGDVQAELVYAHFACDEVEVNLEGKVALIERGECQFSLKALQAQNAGAIAVVIFNHSEGLMNMGAGDYANEVNIPVVLIENNNGQAFVEQLSSGITLEANLSNSNLNITSVQLYDCSGNCISDADQDGVCDADEIVGCTNEDACNYNSEATDSDNSCEYAIENLDCNGNCLNDEDSDGVCDENEVLGCTDSSANNFNLNATEDDGSCEYDTSCGCTDSNYAEYYTQGFEADCDNGSCAVLVQNLGLTPSHFQDPFNSSVNMTVGFELPEMSGLEGAVIAAFYDINGDGQINYTSNECVGYIPYESEFFVMSIWGDDPLSEELDGTPAGATDVIFAVLLANETVMAFNPNPAFLGYDANGLIVVSELDLDVTLYGCMDPAYCNYDAEAEEDDGSCEGVIGCTEQMYVEYDAGAACQLDEACVTTWHSAYLNSEELNAALENEIYLLGESIAEIEVSLGNQVAINEDLEVELFAANAMIDEYVLSLENSNQTISDLELQIEDLLNTISELELSLTDSNNSNQELEGEIADLLQQIEELNMMIIDLQSTNSTLEENLIDANQLNSENELVISSLNESLMIANNTIENLEIAIASQSIEYETAMNECNEESMNLQEQVDLLLLENSELVAFSDSVGSPIAIDLIDGWNIIGYTLKTPQDAVATFADIVDVIGVVKNNAAQVYWPDYGFNGIGDLIPGQGYQIRMYADIDGFTYPDVGGQRIELQPSVPQWALDMPVEVHPNDIRSLVKVVNHLGQEVNPELEFKGSILYYLFSDGTVEKKLKQ